MKNFNRRDFLKLTGMSALALTLAACSDGPSAPVAPAVPAKDAQTLFAAINAYRSKNGQQALVYDQRFEALMKQYASCFEKQQVTSANFNEWYSDPTVNPDAAKVTAEITRLQQELVKDGFSGGVVFYGLEEDSDDDEKTALNALYPKTEEELKTQMEEFAARFGDMRYIGIALATVKGETYWIAALLPKKPTET